MSAKKDVKKKRQPNPYARRARVLARVNTQELQIFLNKAHVYHGGDISELIREAVLVYKERRK